jgi:hypothetical protein
MMTAWVRHVVIERAEYSGPYISGFEYGDRVEWLQAYEWSDAPEFGRVAVSLLKNRPVRIVWEVKPEYDETPGPHVTHENVHSLQEFMFVSA